MEVHITNNITDNNFFPLILRVKNNFGTNVIYPVCQKSQIFAGMMNKKTLSPRDLEHISMLGFRIGFNNIPSDKTEPFNEVNYKGFAKFLMEWNA